MSEVELMIIQDCWVTQKVKPLDGGYLFAADFGYFEATHFVGCLWTKLEKDSVLLGVCLLGWEILHDYPTLKVADLKLPLVWLWSLDQLRIERRQSTTKEYMRIFFNSRFAFKPWDRGCALLFSRED